MSIQALAQSLAKHGRNGDDMLVHMTRDEVSGLAALAAAHGTELTINPHTGLPEAFSLKKAFKSFMPTILGGLLAMTGIGAPMAAGLVGAGTGLAKGSLKKGLIAGLGAYGGAGLANSLSAAGSATPTLAGAKPTMENVGQGLGKVTESGGLDTLKNAANFVGNKPLTAGYGQLAKYGYAAAAPALMAPPSDSGASSAPEDDTMYHQYDFTRQLNPDAYAPEAGYTGEQKWFTDTYKPYSPSSEYRYAGGGITDTQVNNDGMPMLGYAAGGLPAIAMARGRLIQGPGNGVSDSIPALIDGHQPAKLSAGEYVVPSLTVTMLGEGNRDEGAALLDGMVKRIEQRMKQWHRGKDTHAREELLA